jgi:hypothetical protein
MAHLIYKVCFFCFVSVSWHESILKLYEIIFCDVPLIMSVNSSST